MLEVKNVSAYYGDAQALEDVSLTLPDTGITAFLGPNAAGKTTTLKVISGLIRPASGSVWFEGEDITRLTPMKRVDLGIVQVPEGRKLFGSRTVEDNLLLGGYTSRKDGKTKERLDYVYECFPRLLERRTQEAGLLSGGEQQMVAIGRGLMARPKVLMIDEMSLGLAPVVVEQMFELIGSIATSDMSVLLVEQHVQNALEVANVGTVIEGGQTRLTGTAEELLASDVVRESYFGG
ncbi:ABC transporter ATP-binding protein [Gulosibacter sp. 10]|uniref:ABC transporter ATP-binding protein n=1 Tax=Gulosibacter sp. 10 TaxID=1255570 RepID=UPI00097EE15A|nr:ABC transporter ATP-binding protein [Gulosibacter sp. 10]SJM71114.1 Branched-chain amino acid transport ATP-binding protein LivF (TC 3.A.1.4.1) [Gulosibacter sp. 10]